MSTNSDAQRYIDEMVARRGYVLDYHKFMAANDYETLQSVNALVEAAYLKQRSLDRTTKELLFILSLTVLKADLHQIESHIKVALGLGVTPREILEALEIALPEAGVVAFQHGFAAWVNVTGVAGLEPHIGEADPGAGE